MVDHSVDKKKILIKLIYYLFVKLMFMRKLRLLQCQTVEMVWIYQNPSRSLHLKPDPLYFRHTDTDASLLSSLQTD